MTIMNRKCFYCCCRACSGFRCPHHYTKGNMFNHCNRCWQRDFRYWSLECDWFTKKALKHFKLVRVQKARRLTDAELLRLQERINDILTNGKD